MILILAVLLNLIEAVIEAIFNHFDNIKPNKIHRLIEKFHILVVILFFAIWALSVFWLPYELGYIRLFLGFWFVRFLVYDPVWNMTSIILGADISFWYNGSVKLYDRIMFELGGVGIMARFILGIIGICFLLGIE